MRRVFESVLKAEVAPAREQAPAPGRFEGAEEEWRELLKKKGFKDLERALRVCASSLKARAMSTYRRARPPWRMDCYSGFFRFVPESRNPKTKTRNPKEIRSPTCRARAKTRRGA